MAQYILNDCMKKGQPATIICTQPRKIAAISIAERVASTRDEGMGDTVGYAIRGQAKVPRSGGSILFCTNGVLLNKMRCLVGISHIIVDEVHLRDANMDVLLGMLVELLEISWRS